MSILAALSLLMISSPVPAPTPQRTPEERVTGYLKTAMEGLQIPGLQYAVIKGGKVVLQGSMGKANLTYDVPVADSTVFLLASITKSYTAAGIMQLVEQGKIDLDAKVSTYLADAPDSWKDITVRHLLNHTAGLSDRWEEKEQINWRLYYPKETMYEAAKAKPLDYPTGSKFQYSDQGFFLLGMIIEKVSGVSYRQYVTDHLFKPAGMEKSSTFALDEIIPNFASGYSIANGKLINNNRRSVYGMTSHFGIVSNVTDMAKYDQALMRGDIVKKSSMDQMWTPGKLADGSPSVVGMDSYGLGWFLESFNGHRIVQHGGSTGTAYFKLPDDNLTVIVLTNLEQLSGGDATGIARAIAKVYVPELSWAGVKATAPTDPALAETMKSELKKILSGEITIDLYEPAFGKLMAAAIPGQKASLAALGEVQSVNYLTEFTFAGRSLSYEVVFKDLTLYGRVLLNRDNKIIQVLLQGDDVPE
jgi:CubicO group peptidase (beta-lactamase class C family)